MNAFNCRSLVGCLALLLLADSPARAQEPPPPPGAGPGDGISVSGSGEAKGKPTAVEISAVVSGDAELAADAIVKYRDAKRRAVEALEGLKLEGLKIESGGFGINQGVDAAQQQAMMNGNPMAAGGVKQRVTVTEQLTVTLVGLEKLKDDELMDTVLKVVDTGRDGGLQVGPPQPRNFYEVQMFYNSGRGNANLVSFVIPDAESLRERAYKAAMEDARRRAERLASLAGVKLGRIVSVRDQGAATSVNPQAVQMFAMTGQAPPSADPSELTSGVFAEIPVRVNLAVQFEIARGAAPRADAGDADRHVKGVRDELDRVKADQAKGIADARAANKAVLAEGSIDGQRKQIAEERKAAKRGAGDGE